MLINNEWGMLPGNGWHVVYCPLRLQSSIIKSIAINKWVLVFAAHCNVTSNNQLTAALAD